MAALAPCEITLNIKLGGEQVKLMRVEAVESLGQPFTILLDVIADLGELDLLPYLGAVASIKVTQDGELVRYFNGVLVEGEYLYHHSSGFLYRLILKPQSYLISYNKNYRIFQNKSAVDIIKDVLFDGHIQATYNLQRTTAKRIYCVQYGESDFAFVSRLMEEEGIYYYYEHTEDKHTIVLCDGPSSHTAGTPASIQFNQDSATVFQVDSAERGSTANYMQSWHEHVSSGFESIGTLRDFNFETADDIGLEATTSETATNASDSAEVFDYPGGYDTKADGAPYSEITIEERRARRQMFYGESQRASLMCGKKLTLTSHPNKRFNADYMITHITTVLNHTQLRSGEGSGDDTLTTIEAIPANTKWRTFPTARKPVVHGPETGIVTGPTNETIYTDQWGRVKVRFHWDRGTTAPEDSTCWIRVSQTGGLGNIIMPRVGHEVLIEFLDGDPDRPLVVGRVFNSQNKPVYPLDDAKTRAVWRSKTYGDAGSYDPAEALDVSPPLDGNELSFEDKGGSQEVFLYASRDLRTRVRFKETHHVGLDRDVKVGQDETQTIKRNSTFTIHGARAATIDKTDDLTVTGAITTESKDAISIKAATTITLEAQTSIEFKVGQTSVKIDQVGITMTGLNLSAEGKVTAAIKAPMVNAEAQGVMTIKGGITMIN